MEPKKVSNCCQSEMIPPMSEDEMENSRLGGSNWRAASCYICKKCNRPCDAVDESAIDHDRLAFKAKISNISHQDISIFKSTPVYQIFVMRRLTAEKLTYFLHYDMEHEIKEFKSIISNHENEIKKYLFL